MKQSCCFSCNKNETQESVYTSTDTDNKFNSFLYSVLNIHEASFRAKYKSTGKIKNGWIIQGIKTSCIYKRYLYVYSRNSNDVHTTAFYVKYCKILKKVIKEVRKHHHSRLTSKSANKIKAT
jgi:hypothetical protein